MNRKELVIPVYGWEEYHVENGKLYVSCYFNGKFNGYKEVDKLPAITKEEFEERYQNESFWYAQKVTIGMLKFL